MKWLIGLSAMALAAAPFAGAWAVSMDEVLQSSKNHYPKILEARKAVEGKRGAVQKAKGAFDWEFNSDVKSRWGGAYQGQYVDSQISRRLADSAARVYGGYRVSNGDLPVYEQQYLTDEAGELNVGVVVSLWRDRIIDEERAAFKDAQLSLKQQEASLLLTQMVVQYEAMTAYVDWLEAGMVLGVAKQQLEIAQERQKAFKTRVDKGDLAAIYLTENNQTILKREAALNEARRVLKEKATKLSLYYRDEAGKMMAVSEEDVPSRIPEPDSIHLGDLDSEIERARGIRPDLIAISLDLARSENTLAVSQNKILPQVNLYAEGARDFGNRFNNFDRPEARIGLRINIPLQQNVGQGAIRQTEAEIEQIKQRKRLLNDQIAAEIQFVANDYHIAQQNLAITHDEVDTAIKMQKAERTRFMSGASDFFVLNLREENVAAAKLRNIQAQTRVWQAVAGYYMATLQAEKFGLQK